MTQPRHAAPRPSLLGWRPPWVVTLPLALVAGGLGALAAMAVTGR